MRITLVFITLFSLLAPAFAQPKKLNDCVAYMNQSADEVTAVVKSIVEYYPNVKERSHRYRAPYTCPVQLDDYYYNQALASLKTMGAAAGALNGGITALRGCGEKIDAKCKALDTYYKLEDYKKDNYAAAEQYIRELIPLVDTYRQQQGLTIGLIRALQKRSPQPASPYVKADQLMLSYMDQEAKYLSTWNYNINEDVNTGWSVDALQESIQETNTNSTTMGATQIKLKYPASSMLGSFKESLESMLETKRRGLDEYNNEARKSDKHSNDVYLELINYYNGALLADYNGFVGFAASDNYTGVKAVKFVPAFSIREKEVERDITVAAFADQPFEPVTASRTATPIPKATFLALNQYIEFVNDGLHEMDYLQNTIANLDGSARYYKDLTSYKGKGGLHYDYANYQVPLSRFQQVMDASKSIPLAQRTSLNTQATVLLNILKELDQLSAALERETEAKQYESDNLIRLYSRIERNRQLFNIFDERKETLYNDVRKVFEAYAPAQPGNSWQVSGTALQHLVDEDHDALFKAKGFYKNPSTPVSISTAAIDASLRDVIANEYSNMKGIEKIGRNNGLCPYTPYEDLPTTSKTFSEKVSKVAPSSGRTRYQHPYHDMVYLYNNAVDELNKFSELSKDVMLLRSVRQPEWFELAAPVEKREVVNSDPKPNDDHADQPLTEPVVQNNQQQPPVIKSGEVVHDTVYIEKRDTIYLTQNDPDLHSMKGYAINNLVLLLDVSGSMNSPEKLPLLKNTVLSLVSMMREEDEVSIVTYSGKASVALKPTSFKDENQIRKVISRLKGEGKTDANAGIEMAYKVADGNYVRGGNNRIIIATDGEFTISDEVLKMVSKFAGQDIYLTVFSFGKSTQVFKNLTKLVASGRGNYEHISPDDAELKLIRELKAKPAR